MRPPVHLRYYQIVFLGGLFAMMMATFSPLPAFADTPGRGQAGTVVTLFWGVGCPHCEKEKEFLKDLTRKHTELTIRDYEVWRHKENAAIFKRVLQAAGIKQTGVPCTVVGSSVFMGFNDRTRKDILASIERCLREGCPDVMAETNKGPFAPTGESDKALAVPFFGSIDPSRVSLPVFTVVIGALDSFNPCAFFVLLFLLSMLIHARSRGRMLLIGGVFVFFSGLIYFLFMAAWLNVFLVVGQIAAITVAGGIVALLIGGIYEKAFFLFEQGVSLVIPDSAKPKLFERMRGQLKAPTLPAMITGTIVLAISANAYELLCTAGFPMVYTRVLTLHKLTPLQYYQYLVLYNIVYVVPLAVIVGIITVTLGARKLTEWQGRQLKLVSGLMMLSLGAVLTVNPALLNNVLTSIVLLAGVIGVSWIIIMIMKKVRPEITH